MKKFFAILVSLALMLSLAVPAMAADTYSITIVNSVADYTYAAYQIFTGDLSDENKTELGDNVPNTSAKLSNIDWSTDVTYTGAGVVVGTDANGNIYSVDPADIAEALAAGALSLKDFLKDLTLVKETANTSECNNGKYVISGLTPGYYLVKNTDVPENVDNTFYTDYIIEVVENSTVSPKGNYPTSNKKVKDTNDSTSETTDWQDSADYDIGDKVPFKLTGTVPADYGNYAKYYFAFHDKESEGLTFDATSVRVYVDGVQISDNYEVVTEASDKCETCTFEVVFTNLKAISTVKANSIITVEYMSELNENAKIGVEGNPNTMDLEYSNNPHENWEGKDKPDDTGKTPEDKVIVFTYETIVNKVDQNDDPLGGAEFKLEKLVGSEWVEVDLVKSAAGEVAGAVFTATGLDDGKYRLSETQTPPGYNTIEPIEFTITADHDITWESQAQNEVLNSVDGDKGFSVTLDAEQNPVVGSLSADVINRSGTTLPETGGMGTTIFYTVGGVMVAAAAILLVTKKRMSNNA